MGSLYQKGSRFRNPRLRPSVAGMWQKPIFAGGLAGRGRELWSPVTGRFTRYLRDVVLAKAGTTETHPCFVIVSFTAATSWLSVNGFGRKSNCCPSGRLFSNASSA